MLCAKPLIVHLKEDTMKSSRFMAAVAALSLFATLGVYAGAAIAAEEQQPAAQQAAQLGGCPMMQKQGMYNAMTPEMQAKHDAIMEDFYNKIMPLRDKIWAKKAQLRALSGNPNMKPADYTKLTDEIVALRQQMRQELRSLRTRFQKEMGMTPGMMWGGYGHGMMEHGMGGNMMDGDDQ